MKILVKFVFRLLLFSPPKKAPPPQWCRNREGKGAVTPDKTDDKQKNTRAIKKTF